jgi:hypothetical protein
MLLPAMLLPAMLLPAMLLRQAVRALPLSTPSAA